MVLARSPKGHRFVPYSDGRILAEAEWSRPVYCVMSGHVKKHQMKDISGALHYGVPHDHIMVLGCKTIPYFRTYNPHQKPKSFSGKVEVRIIRGVFPIVLLHSNACCAVKPLNSVAKATEAVSANSCCSASSTAACGRFWFRLLASLKRLEKHLGRDNSIVQCKISLSHHKYIFWTFAAAQ